MDLKLHIPIIPAVLKEKGVKHVVIAPGSRNAPLTQVFYSVMPEACISIVDERSAAYFALGIALKTQTPVVVITTSGTAALNLAPAVAEAYHQGVPLILLTADRPKEWLNQQDNQTINQQNIFSENCKASFELPLTSTDNDDLWFTNRIVNESFNTTLKGFPGPVHINVPLREPLYDSFQTADKQRIVDYITPEKIDFGSDFIAEWNSYSKILVICGQNSPNSGLQESIKVLSQDSRIVILSESISNIKGDNILNNFDLTMLKSLAIDTPDLVVYVGGQIISKRIKNYLRSLNNTDFWSVNSEGKHLDTFQHATKIIEADAATFFNSFAGTLNETTKSNYITKWTQAYNKTKSIVDKKLMQIPFSDLWVFKELSAYINENDIVFAGNSSVVRYFQLFSTKAKQVFSNRGTSGIDGCISTPAGIALVTHETVIVITGDLSFVYDSNGLWNRDLPDNLKIIVINNQGGGIFSMIDGPSELESFVKFFEAHHPVSISHMAKTYGVDHYLCAESQSFEESYKSFYASKNTAILEIVTNSEVNTSVFRNFIENIRSDE